MTGTVTDVEDPTSIIQQINANYALTAVALTILYYDYFLTLGREIRLIWRKKSNLVAIVFFLNRYVSILGSVPIILQTYANWSKDVIVAVIVVLRTYALYELNKKIAIMLTSIGLPMLCFSIWTTLGHSPLLTEVYDLSAFKGCHPLMTIQTGIRLTGAWGCLLLFDTIVVILTLRKAILIKRLERRGLFHVLIRDGCAYYIILAMINVSQIISFVIGSPYSRGIVTTFANVTGRRSLSTFDAFAASAVGKDEQESGFTSVGIQLDEMKHSRGIVRASGCKRTMYANG
ncbi:uncharacterized protein FOMMEDRAFT_31296 [Fomitiporia mediterranea MF3/22]|uniref:uncharacterized protein n=1 Tax=Fomitiporia mediterranea (strain MF3/22) TaxID=694068 RepID=UPI0004407861|nr:uncharacterized protein FOMMEDRAFT_31296 [Fomitiporia mediterranea MF3/22]EJC99205.1 hypothetical protein FOMMEDRAFT_31296 [Fomitiporia mediterranea MF3/22]